MPTPFRKWTVLPHSHVTQVDENILSVVGELHMPLTDFPRRMTVVRLSDGRLIIYSAIALDEYCMRHIEAFGAPTFLVVPGDLHRMDARVWKQRYRDMRVIAPAGARARVEEVVPVDSTEIDFGDPSVELVTVDGTEGHECALIVKSPTGTTLIVNDLIGNIQHGSWLMRLAGFAGKHPQIPRVVAMKLLKDKPKLRAQLEAWASFPALKRVIVSHGSPIEQEPAKALRSVAASLH